MEFIVVEGIPYSTHHLHFSGIQESFESRVEKPRGIRRRIRRNSIEEDFHPAYPLFPRIPFAHKPLELVLPQVAADRKSVV